MTSPTSPSPGQRAGRSVWRKRLPYAGGLLLAALLVFGLWPEPLPVETALAARGPLRVTVDNEGLTRVRHRHVVSSPVAGQLQRIDLKPGAPVEAGRTVLAVLETRAADLLDASAEAQAAARVRAAAAGKELAAARHGAARAAATLAATELTRARGLFSSGTVSRREFDLAEAGAIARGEEARAAEFALQVADHELAQAQALLARGAAGGTGSEPLVIRSPVSGRLLRVFQESSRVVPAAFPLVEVGDPGDLEVHIDVLSRDGVAVQPGARVLLEQWGGPEPLEARVRLVEPAAFTKISALGVEEQRVWVIADLVTPPEQRPSVGDGYRVEARIVTWEGTDVLRVPAGALFQRDSTWQVFVLEGGRVRLRPVQPGRSNGLETEILSGLAEGERVVVYPGDRIADGSRVRELAIGH